MESCLFLFSCWSFLSPLHASVRCWMNLWIKASARCWMSLRINFGNPHDQVRESKDQVWEVGDRRWTVEEERRFEKWVEETITEDFFIRYQIPTDCADAVYAIRWIYARIAHLPAAATTREGRWIGHWSTDWKHLPTHPEWHMDERFRAAASLPASDDLDRNPTPRHLSRPHFFRFGYTGNALFADRVPYGIDRSCLPRRKPRPSSSDLGVGASGEGSQTEFGIFFFSETGIHRPLRSREVSMARF